MNTLAYSVERIAYRLSAVRCPLSAVLAVVLLLFIAAPAHAGIILKVTAENTSQFEERLVPLRGGQRSGRAVVFRIIS